jgi:Tfp pilus assembly protein PilO
LNRRAVIFGALIAIGVVALWWVFLFAPKGNDLNDARDQLDDAQSQGQTLTAQRNQLRDLQQRSPEIEADLGRLSAAIPDSPNQADFISGLNDIADESGITWQSVTMQEPTEATPGEPPTIAVQISIEGGFFQTLDYLNRLEDLERVVVVDSVTINSAEAAGATDPDTGLTTSGSGDLATSLNARIFSQSTLDTAATPSGSGTKNGGGSGADNGQVTN